MQRRGPTLAAAVVAAVTLVSLVPAPASAAEELGYGGGVRWRSCEGAPEVDCGTVTVPIDWSKPGGQKIKISLARRKATDPSARVGALLMDPGGPGGPGAQTVRDEAEVFSTELHRRYDVIGFDPRGVGDSHPVICSTAESPNLNVTTAAEFASLRAWNQAHAENCRRHTGPLYDFVDTVSVAHGRDPVRPRRAQAQLLRHFVRNPDGHPVRGAVSEPGR